MTHIHHTPTQLTIRNNIAIFRIQEYGFTPFSGFAIFTILNLSPNSSGRDRTCCTVPIISFPKYSQALPFSATWSWLFQLQIRQLPPHLYHDTPVRSILYRECTRNSSHTQYNMEQLHDSQTCMTFITQRCLMRMPD